LNDPAQLRNAIKEQLRKILNVNYTAPTQIEEGNPFVIVMVGVNGAGKTTTIGKLANRFKKDGKSVMLCASDTFRAAATEPHEVLLVLDATTGQNGLTQAREFTKTAGVTGLVLTKLDGTAKGGVVTAIAKDLKIPIRFVGVGEKMDDLIEFSADDFVDSLFAA